MIKSLLFTLIVLSIFSCSTEKKLRKIEKKLEKRNIEEYIPRNSEFVIKNNKFNRNLFNKNYSPSVKYEFYYNKHSHLLSNQKTSNNTMKLNYYYLTPITYYHVNKFNYHIKNFDFLYYKNLFRIISLTNSQLVLFSTGNDNIIGEIPKEINIFKNKKLEILIHEENPLFYNYFINFINFKYKFKTIKSYIMLKYSKRFIKNKYGKEIIKNPYILIVSLKDFEEISQFKKIISKTYFHYTVNLKDIYSTKDKSLYMFFNGDKIIFAKNMNVLKVLDKINKIPLTKLKKNNKNNGYIMVENKEYLENIFPVFKKIKFKGKIVYYFFDYRRKK